MAEEQADLPGALVAMPSAQTAAYREDSRFVATDAKGDFMIATGYFDTSLSLEAYLPWHGLGRVMAGPLASGEVSKPYTIKLPGATRISGIVTDPKGRPIEDVVCLVQWVYPISGATGADGRFDLGRVSLPSGRRTSPITYRAPRPGRGDAWGTTYSFDSKYYEVTSRAKAPQFYDHRQLMPVLSQGRGAAIKVVLQPTRLLEITGRVVDAKDAPVADARVVLFTGDATLKAWRRRIDSWKRSTLDIGPGVTSIGGAQTDKEGRWRFWTVRENGVATPIGGRRTDWTRFCVGVRIMKTNQLHLVRDIVVPKDNPRRELTITLPAKPAKGGAKK